jgi:UDPglucose 6-dehydrogenase
MKTTEPTQTTIQKPKRIGVIGAGHVGLVTAACFADMGHCVTCMDIDHDRIEQLKQGILWFHEPGLQELVDRHNGENLQFTTDYQKAVKGAEFVFLAVATPSTVLGTADLRFVRAAARGVARAANGVRPILVSKSTAPVGITETLENVLQSEANGSEPLSVVANPEFLREGTAVEDFMKPDRVVVGSADIEARAKVAELYEPLNCPVLYTDIKTAEMVKYASNAFLATKISFINEIAEVCEKVGADVRDVARGMGLDPRIGPQFLAAGIGFGGSCLPKDVKALSHLAMLYGSHPQLLNTVLEINAEQRRRLISRLRNVLGSLRGARIAVLGLAFKAGTDDTRESPAFDLVRLLEYEEASVVAYDPFAMEFTKTLFPDIEYASDPYQAAVGCDALILATDWPEIKDMDLDDLRALMRTPVLADGRNAWDPDEARAKGFTYLGMGLPDNTSRPVQGVMV